LSEQLDRLLDLADEELARELARIAAEDAAFGARLRAAIAVAKGGEGPIAGSAAESWPELWPGPGEEEPMPGELAAGDEVGRWRITGELGRGGMGHVYAVERADGTYEQQAALKLVRLGLDDPVLRERFRRERQILARLEHPSIARLLDGGVAPDGRPYLVLERVEGEPITRWCERRRLGLRDRVRLFGRVLEAVAHAHRSLVVHRDLKPSNVMVTAEGAPKLLDFGIAKLLAAGGDAEPTELTAAAPLTPQYAAPEQIRGEPVTTATDVYGLGVLLYELVCGERPYRIEGGGAAAIERAVLESDPPPPSSWPGAARETARGARQADLDAIVLRALAKSPRERYPSADDLARDLGCWLEGRPVEARRLSRLGRARRFVRRHRLAVAAGAILLIATFAALAGLGIALRETRARLAAAERARASMEFLVGLFEGATPESSRDHTISAVELLDRGAERLERELAGPPETRAELARTLGGVYRSLGLFDRARPLLERAHDETRQLFGEASEEHAAALHELAALEYDLDRYREAETLLRRAIAVLEHRRGPRDAVTLELYSSLADVLGAAGRYEEGLEIDRRLHSIRREQFGDGHVATLEDLSGIAMTLRRLGRFEEAERHYRELVAASERILGSEHPDVLDRKVSSANVLRSLGRFAEAEEILRGIVATRERIFGPDHPETASALDSLGGALREQGRFGEALATTRRALEIQVATIGPDASETAVGRNNLAILAVTAGDYEAAESGFREALRIWSASLDPDHPHRSSALANLGFVLVQRGRAQEALPLIRESLSRRAGHFGEESLEAALSWRILALAHLHLGEISEARRAAGEAERRIASAVESDHPRRADAAIVRAEVELGSGESVAAEELAHQALAIREAALGPAAPKTTEARLVLVRVLVARGRLDEARPELERARADLARAFEATSWRHGEVELAGAELAFAHGDRSTAVDRLAAARDRFERDRLDQKGPVGRRASALAQALRP
jgi:serine/threonine-protein kinase